MNENENDSWYDRPPRLINSDRTHAPGGREFGRPSRPANGSRQGMLQPKVTAPFQDNNRPRQGILLPKVTAPFQDGNEPFANEFPGNEPPKAPKSGGLFKSPFPVAPSTRASRTFQDRSPAEHEVRESAEPDALPSSPFQEEHISSPPDAREMWRPPSAPPVEPAFDDEAMGEPPMPSRHGRDDGEGQQPFRRGGRRKGADFSPPGQVAVPGSGKKSHRVRSTILKVLLASVLLIGCSTTSFALAYFYQLYTIAQSVTGVKVPNVGTAHNKNQPTPLPDNLAGVNAFNLLLLGSDNDAKFTSGAVLTQTDIVVRVDLKGHKITMLSIPRDFWIPNDYGRCCYKLDQISGDETYGPGDPKLNGFAHTEATIENDFGIPISGFAWVGLQGFVNVINTLGGVDVDVLHPIVDDAYPKDINNNNPYDYQRLYIPAGPQHLDGEEALDYVRSRHSDLTGDFGRSARQQSVLIALKKKLDPTLITKLPEIAGDLKNDVLTSLTIPQVLSLANFARGLKPTDFVQVVLSAPTYASNATVNGESVVLPNSDAIKAEIQKLFPDAVPPQVNLHNFTAKDLQTVKTEGARIQIQNASGVPGVAAKLEAFLKGQGFNVIGVADAPTSQLTTDIQEYSSNGTKFDGTVQVLQNMLGVLLPQNNPQPPSSGVDIVIVIGSDTASQIQQQVG